MLVEVWQDYVCPWAYLGRNTTTILQELGFEVRPRPFELHPELPATPTPVRPGGRLAAVLDRIGAECLALGIPFSPPTSTPNTRLALSLAELVRLEHPERFAEVDAELFRRRFTGDADLSSPAVLADLLADLDLDRSLVGRAEGGEGFEAVAQSMDQARDAGVTATPTWRFASGFVIPGVQPAESIRRWGRRLIERPGGRQ